MSNISLTNLTTKVDPLFIQFLAQNGILDFWENLQIDFKNGKISREFLIEKIAKIVITAKVSEEIQNQITQNSSKNLQTASQNSNQIQAQNSLQISVKNKSANKSEIRQKIEKIDQINTNFHSNYQNKTQNKTIIIGNGDVLSLSDAFEKVCEFGVDGVMIGRGIFGNPWLFGGIDANLKSPRERVNLLIFHLNLWQKTWQSGKNYQSLKKYFKIYIQGFAGAVELRGKLMETDKIEKAVEIATNYLENC